MNMVGDFTVKYDDGRAIFADEVRIGGHEDPNSEKTTIVPGFDSGLFGRLYLAATVIHRF